MGKFGENFLTWSSESPRGLDLNRFRIGLVKRVIKEGDLEVGLIRSKPLGLGGEEHRTTERDREREKGGGCFVN